LTNNDALQVIQMAPTPELGKALSDSKIAAAFLRGGRQARSTASLSRSKGFAL